MSKIAVIGAGEIGQAIGGVLEPLHEVSYWDKRIEPLNALGLGEQPLPEVMEGVDAVFLCVPSWAMRECLFFTIPYLKKETIVVSVAKGLEESTGKTMSEMLGSSLPKNQPFIILGGMLLAEELRSGLFGGALAASFHLKAAEFIQNLFSGTRIRVDISDDVLGVSLAGVLKNIYALALGSAEGLGWGDNAKGFLVTQSADEMRRLIKNLGGSQNTIFSSAGLGDYIATGFSRHSKNHQAGINLALGREPVASEGMISLPFLIKRLEGKTKSYPVLEALWSAYQDADQAKQALMEILYL